MLKNIIIYNNNNNCYYSFMFFGYNKIQDILDALENLKEEFNDKYNVLIDLHNYLLISLIIIMIIMNITN